MVDRQNIVYYMGMFMMVNRSSGNPLGIVSAIVQDGALQYKVGDASGALVSGILTSNNRESLERSMKDPLYSFILAERDIDIREFSLCQCE